MERYLDTLAAHGVTVLRLMLEYGDGGHRYIENPVGVFRPEMVRLWDDLFALCERRGLRVLLTPFDTFWTWLRWHAHPYNQANGGPCDRVQRLLLCPQTRAAIKNRLAFVVRRWGGSGAFFAWDLWNELHPSYAGDSPDVFHEFIDDLSRFVSDLEHDLYGRAHPRTVSLYWESVLPHVNFCKQSVADSIYRHPGLDFASTHFYAEGTIDHPQNTVDPALSVGQLMRAELAELGSWRPFFDSESGPIHTFKDFHRTLSEPFDDEYFRHMQWAHFASGGAGGGMRWPNRRPHSLTLGMRVAQRGLARFLPCVDWTRFRRRNLNEEVRVSGGGVAAFACGDEQQALLWLLRRDRIGADGMLRRDVEPLRASVYVPGLTPGRYTITAYDTIAQAIHSVWTVEHAGDSDLCLEPPPFVADLALAVAS